MISSVRDGWEWRIWDLMPLWMEDLIWVEVDMSVVASNRLNMVER